MSALRQILWSRCCCHWCHCHWCHTSLLAGDFQGERSRVAIVRKPSVSKDVKGRQPKSSKGYVVYVHQIYQIVQDSSPSSASFNASNKRQEESAASLQALQMNFARVKVLHLQLMRRGRSRQRNALSAHHVIFNFTVYKQLHVAAWSTELLPLESI